MVIYVQTIKLPYCEGWRQNVIFNFKKHKVSRIAGIHFRFKTGISGNCRYYWLMYVKLLVQVNVVSESVNPFFSYGVIFKNNQFNVFRCIGFALLRIRGFSGINFIAFCIFIRTISTANCKQDYNAAKYFDVKEFAGQNLKTKYYLNFNGLFYQGSTDLFQLIHFCFYFFILHCLTEPCIKLLQ